MTGSALNVSLFDVEDLTETIKVRDMHVASVSTKDVTEFCRRYHYAVTGGTMNWRWGLWHGPMLLGVVAYNPPTRETCEVVFGPDHYAKVWHMGRLALADMAPRNSESRLIAGSLRLIRLAFPTVWGVVTYAATDQGHIGYVYQATNALYTGTAGHTIYYVDPKGHRRSDYLDGEFVSGDRAKALGWEKRTGGPKHRYVYVLGDKRERRGRLSELRLPILPYPKAPT